MHTPTLVHIAGNSQQQHLHQSKASHCGVPLHTGNVTTYALPHPSTPAVHGNPLICMGCIPKAELQCTHISVAFTHHRHPQNLAAAILYKIKPICTCSTTSQLLLRLKALHGSSRSGALIDGTINHKPIKPGDYCLALLVMYVICSYTNCARSVQSRFGILPA